MHGSSLNPEMLRVPTPNLRPNGRLMSVNRRVSIPKRFGGVDSPISRKSGRRSGTIGPGYSLGLYAQ